MRSSVREAKLIRVGEVIADAEEIKSNIASLDTTVSEVRLAQSEATKEVLEAGGSVAAVEAVPLVSDRV